MSPVTIHLGLSKIGRNNIPLFFCRRSPDGPRASGTLPGTFPRALDAPAKNYFLIFLLLFGEAHPNTKFQEPPQASPEAQEPGLINLVQLRLIAAVLGPPGHLHFMTIFGSFQSLQGVVLTSTTSLSTHNSSFRAPYCTRTRVLGHWWSFLLWGCHGRRRRRACGSPLPSFCCCRQPRPRRTRPSPRRRRTRSQAREAPRQLLPLQLLRPPCQLELSLILGTSPPRRRQPS